MRCVDRVLVAVVALMCGCTSSSPDPEKTSVDAIALEDRLNLLVIDIDSMRQDRLGRRYGERSITPNLDALVAEAVRFDAAVSQGSWTLPALAAQFTGQLPVAGGRGGGAWLSPKRRVIAEILKLYGYRTAAFWGSTLGQGFTEFGRGFEVSQSWSEETVDTDPVGDFFRWRDEDGARPFYAFLHVLDMHAPRPALTQTQAHEFVDEDGACPETSRWREIHEVVLERLDEDAALRHLEAHYDASLYVHDAQIGALFDGLKKRGLWDNTAVLVLSDHGEELGEHVLMEHGVLFDSVLRIPFVLRVPGQAPGVVSEGVETIDVAPTLLELAGLPLDRAMTGRSVLGLLAGDTREARPVISVSHSDTLSVRTPTEKLIHTDLARAPSQPAGDPRISIREEWEFFDLAADPGERNNLYDPKNERIREMQALLEAKLKETSSAPRSQYTPEQIRLLRQQGYWEIAGGKEEGAPPRGKAPRGKRSPKRKAP